MMTSDPPNLAAMGERLDRIERCNEHLLRQNRQLKRVVLSLLVAVVTVPILHVFLTGPVQAQKAESNNLAVYRDEKGKARVLVGVVGKQAGLFINDQTETERLRVNVTPEGPTCSFCDEGGHRRIKIHLDQGQPVVVLNDGQGKPRLSLGVIDDDASVQLFDQQGAGRLLVQTRGDGASLSLASPEGKMGVIVGLKKGKPSLNLLDEAGKVLFSQP